jgi:NCS1 family nucleobase:cation symporter-1
VTDTIKHEDGRVELNAPEELHGSALYSEDLAPIAVAKRKWNTWDFAALWISMAHCIPTYTLASGMIVQGFTWGEALTVLALGNVIVLAPILLNSHPGTKYGIPFPVFARAAYGTVGSNLPALMRALVACGWFGINAWYGGQALHVFFASLWPDWLTLLGSFNGYATTQWIAFLLFWGLNIVIIYRGMELVRRLERFAAPFVLVMTAFLVAWAIYKVGGFVTEGVATSNTARFIPSLTATIGFWSTLSLNMPDFTRYGRSQREQVWGQVVALPSTMTVFGAMAIIITSATAVIFQLQQPIADPIDLAPHFENRLIIGIVMFTVVIATLAVNIAANVVSPANDFANAFPRFITFARGGLITGLLGIAMMPWELVKNPGRYIGWLIGYSGSLGSVAGVLIVDYWVLRKTELDLRSLYVSDGAYRYDNGWNWAAVWATVAGAIVALLGAFWEPMAPIYDWSWFVGFGLAGGLYWILMRERVHPRRGHLAS